MQPYEPNIQIKRLTARQVGQLEQLSQVICMHIQYREHSTMAQIVDIPQGLELAFLVQGPQEFGSTPRLKQQEIVEFHFLSPPLLAALN